jgi:hypothetical protein
MNMRRWNEWTLYALIAAVSTVVAGCTAQTPSPSGPQFSGSGQKGRSMEQPVKALNGGAGQKSHQAEEATAAAASIQQIGSPGQQGPVVESAPLDGSVAQFGGPRQVGPGVEEEVTTAAAAIPPQVRTSGQQGTTVEGTMEVIGGAGQGGPGVERPAQ